MIDEVISTTSPDQYLSPLAKMPEEPDTATAVSGLDASDDVQMCSNKELDDMQMCSNKELDGNKQLPADEQVADSSLHTESTATNIDMEITGESTIESSTEECAKHTDEADVISVDAVTSDVTVTDTTDAAAAAAAAATAPIADNDDGDEVDDDDDDDDDLEDNFKYVLVRLTCF